MSQPRLSLLAAGLLLSSASFADDLASRFQVHGFATLGGSYLTEDFGGRYLQFPYDEEGGIDGDVSYKHDSVLGLQVNARLHDQLELVVQGVAAGRYDNQKPRAEWAYLNYRPVDGLSIKAGRIAVPYYMFSQNINVGHGYTWARLPELYSSIPFQDITGLDLTYTLPLGDWNLETQLTAGRSQTEWGDVKRTRIASLTLANGPFSVRTSYARSRVDGDWQGNLQGNAFEQLDATFGAFGVDFDVKNEVGTFTDFGMLYDDGNWFAAGELGRLAVRGHLYDLDAAYVSVGHYVGRFLPYVLLSKVNTIGSAQCRDELQPAVDNAYAAFQGGFIDQMTFMQVAGAQNVYCQGKEQTSYAAGFRFDATKNVSLKVQYDYVTDFHDTAGYILGVTERPTGVLSDDDSTEVITFNINAAF